MNVEKKYLKKNIFEIFLKYLKKNFFEIKRKD